MNALVAVSAATLAQSEKIQSTARLEKRIRWINLLANLVGKLARAGLRPHEFAFKMILQPVRVRKTPDNRKIYLDLPRKISLA
jgi:hypothetical protein